MIAVTGASGQLGGLIARLLAVAGERTRLIGRSAARLPVLPGGTPAPVQDYADGASMGRALAGTDTLLLVSATEAPDRVEQHAAAIDAAGRAGVRRIVYVSFVGAAPDATFTFARDHWHTEQYLTASGLAHTVLRDNLYLAGLPAMVGDDGVLRGPGGTGRVAAVAHEDVAAVAATVLTGDGFDGVTLDVTGPEALTLSEAAEVIGRFAGRPVHYEAETEQQAYASRARYGAPDWAVAGWVSSYLAIAAGELAAVRPTVPDLTGYPARTLADFLAEHPDSYRHLVR
ncbi:NAD(P)-dependent oxidoreductase [Actinocatenispora thailandica]|uniref:NAD(P)-dependent oxidoreductase n=1 Tax=Actinocatenispora thailandica TaxID=227318 RepID=A0A7R7DQ89_9ACTN|nr:SDR family oxidoreductase [Actinocatenispora thailandica]BCJ35686.1 NAD(P)-dependent oxidoreductase [Actinocatenispora thailandica]